MNKGTSERVLFTAANFHEKTKRDGKNKVESGERKIV